MRSRVEWLARVVALLALGAAWWMWQFPQSAARLTDAIADSDRTGSNASVATVAALLRSSGLSAVQLSLQAVPERESRVLLHAARDAGWPVEWNVKDAVTPAATPAAVAARVAAQANSRFLEANAIAVAAIPRVHPSGGTIIHVAAANDVELTLSDSLGWIDSVRVSNRGTYWEIPGNARAFSVRSPTAAASVADVRADTLKRIRLFASTGWESRFILDALESAGWQVDANFAIAPRVNVTAGIPAALDTSRYAAVIALDSSAWSQSASITRFVRSGGGLLLFPGSARGNAFASVRAGGVGTALAGIPGALQTDTPTEGLPLSPVTGLASDAVVMARSEREGAPVTIAARRFGAGRVVQAGFEQTWEWRMLGAEQSVHAHREWWNNMVQRVAFSSPAPVPERWQPLPGDAAPLADLIARIGGPTSEFTAHDGVPSPSVPPRWLFVVAAAALLVEWWSRRLRGAV